MPPRTDHVISLFFLMLKGTSSYHVVASFAGVIIQKKREENMVVAQLAESWQRLHQFKRLDCRGASTDAFFWQ